MKGDYFVFLRVTMRNFIQGNSDIITINRGDTLNLTYFINAGTPVCPARYELQGDDKLYFGVMYPNHYWEQSLIKKVFTAESPKTRFGDVIITLNSEDTEYIVPGTYYYRIKLLRTFEDGTQEVTTVTDKTLFYVV